MKTRPRNSSTHAQASAPAGHVPMARRITAGIVGGLAGGAVFGVLMAMMGMLPMIASLVGSDAAVVGLAVHLVISVLIGLGLTVPFAGMLSGLARSAVIGLAYGALWWLLGPLLLMPTMMGMPVFMIDAAAWVSLLGHLIYGIILGVSASAMLRGRR
ncbi:hypothetical protein SAMN04488693_12234 [Arthrobacter subterraneus]|uniref:Uncharacterized protein n=1 Tax=Arthrobacter subterraneus TaxID=335973 RepID=A0A1G8N8D7_9MICC|nr:hypothetical protein [Arthrobacter subterraneus]SDI76468.1 hypothetical protein SAMN04488693_12234 [Arthrobacter subterraneus]